MNLYLLANIITGIGAFVGFFYGACRYFHPRKAVYAQRVTMAAGCMAFGRLYQVIRLLTSGDIFSRFHLGLLGVIGSLLFFFSTNFGVMDTITDDGAPENRRCRLIPAAAPALTAVVYLAFFLLADQPLIIFPDEYGIILCLQP